jgi:hypothetical protein
MDKDMKNESFVLILGLALLISLFCFLLMFMTMLALTNCSSVSVKDVKNQYINMRRQEDLNQKFKNLKTGGVVTVTNIIYDSHQVNDIRYDITYIFVDESGDVIKVPYISFHYNYKKVRRIR